jgi:CBS domain-containing protein
MESVTLVRDIMTSDPVCVTPQAKVVDVVRIFTEKKFNGLPVVDEKKKLVGLVTEYNLISAETLLHLPTLEKISRDAASSLGDLEYLSLQVKKTAALTVSEVMEKNPITLLYDDTFEFALEVLNKHHRVNPIPVIDKEGILVGVVSRYDLLKLLKLFGHT